LLDGRDSFRIAEEALRLLGLYGASRSFQKYVSRFLIYLYAKNLNSPDMTGKKLANLYRCLSASQEPALFRLALGYCALRNAPLSSDQAFNVLKRLSAGKQGALKRKAAPGRRGKIPGRRPERPRPLYSGALYPESQALRDLFALRYQRAYPRGFVLSASRKRAVVYSIASGTLEFAGGLRSPEPALIPDVLAKTSQFKGLRAIWDSLTPQESADELVVARAAGEKKTGEPLPLVRIDMNRVAALREETETLTRELAAILGADDPAEDVPSSRPPELVKPAADAPEPPPLPFPQEALRALDSKYWPCLPQLLQRTAWNRKELSALARRHGLMPNAMLEDLNAWGMDELGDFLLLEENEGWLLNRELT
jgi:hypothetical protein